MYHVVEKVYADCQSYHHRSNSHQSVSVIVQGRLVFNRRHRKTQTGLLGFRTTSLYCVNFRMLTPTILTLLTPLPILLYGAY